MTGSGKFGRRSFVETGKRGIFGRQHGLGAMEGFACSAGTSSTPQRRLSVLLDDDCDINNEERRAFR